VGKFRGSFAPGLGALLVAFSVQSAAAEPANEPANDVAPGATNPPNQKRIWELSVVLQPSAAHLPEGEIRHAIARELNVPVGGPTDVATRTLSIALEANHLVVRFQTPDGTTERLLPFTDDREQLVTMLALLAGNLARDQRPLLSAKAGPSPPPNPAPPPAQPPRPPTPIVWEPPPPTRVAPFRQHLVGFHLAQDIAFVGGDNVCDPKLGQATENYACFYRDTTDEPFFHTPYPLRDGTTEGVAFATTRVLASYDYALAAYLSVGGRVGFAFGGGPPAGQQPAGEVRNPPAHAKGTGGAAFMPWHLELRGAFWFLPQTEKYLRAFVLVGAGLAQVDAKVEILEYDCEDAGLLPDGTPNPEEPYGSPGPGGTFVADPNGMSPYDQCRSGQKTFYKVKNHDPVPVDAWKKLGQAFVEAGLGAVLTVAPNVGISLEGKLLYLLPSNGIVVQPALGVVVGL
jgi:hypothetical protein